MKKMRISSSTGHEPDHETSIKITASMMDLKMVCPLFFAALCALPRCCTDQIPAVAVSPGRLYYNEAFIRHLNRAQLNYYLIHEMFHILMNHHARGWGKDLARWNEACDIYVNKGIAEQFGVVPGSGEVRIVSQDGHEAEIEMPDHVYFSELVDIRRDTPESIYQMLQAYDRRELPLTNGNISETAFGKDGSEAREGEDGETHQNDDDLQSEEKEESPSRTAEEENMAFPDLSDLIHDEESFYMTFSELDRCNAAVIEKIRKLASYLPGARYGHGIQSDPIALRRLSRQRTNMVDWRTLFLCRVIQAEDDELTLACPDRRFAYRGLYVEGRRIDDRKINGIRIGIDTSASMKEEQINNILEEIYALSVKYDLDGEIIFWDQIIEDVVPLRSKEDVERARKHASGKGGTDTGCLFELLEKEIRMGEDVELIVVFTDGAFPTPEKRFGTEFGMRTIWVQCAENTMDQERFNPGFGTISCSNTDPDRGRDHGIK